METLIAQYERIQAVKPSKARAFIGMLPVNFQKNRYSGNSSFSFFLTTFIPIT